MTTKDRDALAAKYFPTEWAKAQLPGKSKKRNQLRNAAEHMQKKDALRAQGASCANCSSFRPTSYSPTVKGGSWCAAESDFYGYSLTKPENLCHRWTQKKE